MKVITAADVNDAYSQGVALLLQQGERQESRAGEVLVYHEPVVTKTIHPEYRVLLCPERRANPFFHLFESLWMLSGRDDATWLDQFVSDFSDRFAEPDGTQWGAYGYRWREHFEMDQLRIVAEKLRRDPLDRRVVIAMWDPEEDLASEEKTDTGQPARDLPCNTHIYPRVVGGALDLTVCCRSNDAYWGAHGANAVHFSVLQEYLAAKIGVEVGRMFQVSNNYHGYTAVLPRSVPAVSRAYWGPQSSRVEFLPMITDPETFDEDLLRFMHDPLDDLTKCKNTWFRRVAQPMWSANLARLERDWEKYDICASHVMRSDWRAAAKMWRPA